MNANILHKMKFSIEGHSKLHKFFFKQLISNSFEILKDKTNRKTSTPGLLQTFSKFVFLQDLIICFLVCPFMTGDKGGGHM